MAGELDDSAEDFNPCREGENPETDNCTPYTCLNTCKEGENPEEDLCTPYSVFDYNDIYNIPSPCSADLAEDECIIADKRTCAYDEEPSDRCIRMCGLKTVPKVDEEGKEIEGEVVEVPEDPNVDNCTKNPPLSYEKIQEIYDSCRNPLEENYNTCKSNYVNSCRNVLNNSSTGFCLKNKRDQTWEETSCNDIDSSNSNFMVRYCERNFIDGKCFNNSEDE